MGSVLDYIDCPNCKHEATMDFYYKTGEEYVFCSHCGYYSTRSIINRAKPLNQLTPEDWEHKLVDKPFGAFRVRYKGKPGATLGCIHNEEEWQDIKNDVMHDSDVVYLALSRLIEGNIVVDVIININDEH